MKNSIAKKLIAIVAVALLIFSAAIIFVIDNANKKAAQNYATNLLGVFESQMLDGEYTTLDQYQILVEYSNNARDIRVSVIDPVSGMVLADTLSSAPGALVSHSNRPEVAQAIGGGMGKDIRKSETFGTNYLYVARVVTIDNIAVVLRVSIPISSVNAYLAPVFIAMAVIFVVILMLIFVVSKALSAQIIRPINLIKKKLQTVGLKGEDNPLELTKYDDVNEILIQVDDISNQLDGIMLNREAEREKLNFILESMNQGIITVDKTCSILMMNQVASDIFNSTIPLPTSLLNIIRDPIVTEAVEKTLSSARYQELDISLRNNRLFELRILPAEYEDIRAIIILFDVSDARKLQTEKQEFFQNASHELNTPLTSILGYSEILLKEERYNATFVDVINREASRMRLLISDMLKIADLESGAQIIDEPIAFDGIVRDVANSLKIKAESKNITIEQRLIEASIMANPEKIREIVSNLLDNAIKYTECGGVITLSMTKTKERLIFTVKDTGIGIPRQYLGRVFERFFRADRGRGDGSTGLGLAIVKHICSYYKVPISIDSQVGVGTEISISFELV